MNPAQLIARKRDGHSHSREEIEALIRGVTEGSLESHQIAAWLMAVWFRGMTEEETGWLTEAMLHSGEVVDLSCIEGIKVDKHSTGGVGDTTTLVLAPLLAAAGARVAKMSGRGLGHTGGTLDKMEAAGLKVDLDAETFLDQVQRIGVAVISQTRKLVPADGILYGLRDVTATIDSIPLIASSIMSKKLACGADAILLDVKFGDGAFMADLEQARLLAQAMVAIGQRLGKKVRAALSDMNTPLGSHIGNALEFSEAISVLTGQRADSRLARASLKLAEELLLMTKLVETKERAEARLRSLLDSGQAAQKLKELMAAQGGDPDLVDNPSRLPKASLVQPVKATRKGFVTAMRARAVGETALALGAGRARKSDTIDPSAGLILRSEPGQPVHPGQILAELHGNESSRLERAAALFQEAVTIGEQPPAPKPLVEEILVADGDF